MDWRAHPARRYAPYLLGLIAVGLTSPIAATLRPAISTADAAMIHLLPVLLVAAWFSTGPSIVTSLAAALSWHYFFSRPFFGLGFDDPQDFITLIVFVLTAVTVSYWSSKSGRQAEDLRRQAAQAEASRLQAALLASVSHDFRNPLATIIGAASTLRDGAQGLTAGNRAALLTTIEESGKRLHRFVINLLDAGRLEAGPVALNRDWWELGDLVGATLDHADAETRARVDLRLADGLPLLRLDFVLMEHVLQNLLDNAVKYSVPETPITVAAREAAGEVVVEVSNRAAGPVPDPARLFERFYRADDRPDRQGTGLGLAICKGFVEAHGGRISAAVEDGRVTIALAFPVEGAGRSFATELGDEVGDD